MASLNTEIIIKEERRPCYVDGKKAMFHKWAEHRVIVSPSLAVGGHNGGVVTYQLALVEYENGKVDFVRADSIVFADGGDFADCAFFPCCDEEAINRVNEVLKNETM